MTKWVGLKPKTLTGTKYKRTRKRGRMGKRKTGTFGFSLSHHYSTQGRLKSARRKKFKGGQKRKKINGGQKRKKIKGGQTRKKFKGGQKRNGRKMFIRR